MGRAKQGEHLTPLQCGIRVLNVTREDGLDVLLSLHMLDSNDGRRVEVLLDDGSRAALRTMLEDEEGIA